MKKILIIFVIAAMLIVSILPVVNVSSDDVENIAGHITYAPNGGGIDDPIEIVAIWETNGLGNLDDDTSKPGCQIDPPLHWDAWSTVCVYVAVYDPDLTLPEGNTNVVKIDISWPNNALSNRQDLGLGGTAENGYHIEPVLIANWSHYELAHAKDSIPSNNPFICYYNSANDDEGKDGYDFIYWATSQSNIKFYRACYDLYYHYPAGWYDAEVTVQQYTTSNEKNYFEYVHLRGIKTDFSELDWGKETELGIWHEIDGDWEWEGLPTIKNIGNWDVRLKIHFSSDDFGPFGPSNPINVLFDWRAGESNPIFNAYNQSYCEKNNIPGIKLCSDYGPLPINNYNEFGTHTYDDALMKCHKAKLDFYIKVLQWYSLAGEYVINIDITAYDPIWSPSPHPDCVPCGCLTPG